MISKKEKTFTEKFQRTSHSNINRKVEE